MVSNPQIKRAIREGAEQEEREFYAQRAPDDWLQALAPLGTDDQKPFPETAPCLIVIFAEKFGIDDQGKKLKNYYVPESVGRPTTGVSRNHGRPAGGPVGRSGDRPTTKKKAPGITRGSTDSYSILTIAGGVRSSQTSLP